MGWFAKDEAVETPAYPFTNIIGAGTVVKGDIRAQSLRIDGTVDGLVEATGPVHIGETGAVTGCVRASDLVIMGRVEGDVEASGDLEVGPRGRVIGDIAVRSFRMHKGGIFRGVSRMADDGVPRLEEAHLPLRATEPPVSQAAPPGPPPLVSQKRLVAGENGVASLSSSDLLEENDADLEDRIETAMNAK